MPYDGPQHCDPSVLSKRRLLLQCSATALGQWLERIITFDGALQVVVVPCAFRLRRRFHLEQVHVVHHTAVRTQLAVLGEHVVDGGLLHLLHHRSSVVRARSLHSLQIMNSGFMIYKSVILICETQYHDM